jgi:hypothetical protein
VRIERRRAVWADDAEVLKPVVVANAVHVIEDQAHRAATPGLVLPAQLTPPFLESFVEKPALEMAAAIGGAFNEDFGQGGAGAARAPARRLVRVEMIRPNAQSRYALLQRAPVAARRAVAQTA